MSALDWLHEVGAWFMIGANGLVGLWSLGAHRYPRLRTRALWWATTVAQLAIFVDVALGVGILAAEDREAPSFHSFYGFVAIITVAILYSYREQLRPHRYLLYGGGGLFLMGLGLRAVQVGIR